MASRRELISRAAAAMGGVALMQAGAAKAGALEANVSFNVLYPNHDGGRFDIGYYRATHIPLVMRVMKASGVVLIEGVPMGGAAAPYAMIAHFQFASAEALQAALGDPGMGELRADVAKFTDIRPVISFGKSV